VQNRICGRSAGREHDGALGEVLDVEAEGARAERVADDRPLRLAPQAENLSKVVDQARQDEPARVPVFADADGFKVRRLPTFDFFNYPWLLIRPIRKCSTN